MQPEARYKAKIRKLVLPQAYVLANANRYAGGVPDHWYSAAGGDLWIEYKYLTALPKEIFPLKLLSPLQADWLRERHQENRAVGLIIGSPHGGYILPGVSWDSENPLSRDKFLAHAGTPKAISQWIISCVTLPATSLTKTLH